MYPVTSRFLTATQQDYVNYVTLAVYPAGGTDPIFSYDPTLETADTASSTMKVLDGSVTHDKQSQSRMRLSNLKIVDPTFALMPQTANDPFSPFGNEIAVSRGVLYSDGTTETVPLGRFRMTSVNCEDKEGAATLTISGYDRSWIVASNLNDHYWPTPTPFPYLGVSYTTYARALISFAYPNVVFDADEATWTSRQFDATIAVPSSLAGVGSFYQEVGSNPWARAYEICRTVGCSVFFDRAGVCTLQTDPAFAYTTSAPTSVRTLSDDSVSTMVDVARNLDGEKVFNRIIVTGIGAALNPLPLRSDPAEDTDPNSPTYVNGNFGKRLKMVSTNYITNLAHANTYAHLILRTTIGKQRAVTITSIADTCYDIDDIFTVNRSRVGLTNVQFAVDNLTFPLRGDQPMQLKLREVRNIPGVTS